MKKIIWGCLVLLILFGVVVAGIVYYLFFSMSRLPVGEYLYSSSSPDQTYTINFYRANGGATTGLSIRGELVENDSNGSENIYWEYQTDQANVRWINDHTVVINGHTLDVRKDIYDWRRE